MTPFERLELVRSDGSVVLDRLQDVLRFVETSKPDPVLRVLMTNSVIVTGVSAVEDSIRQLFEGYLAVLEQEVDSHKRLRPKLRESNFSKSLFVLQRVLASGDEVAPVARLEELKRCITGDPGYRLASSALSNNQANFKSKQVTEIASQIGVINFWRRLTDHAEVADYVGVDMGPQCEQRFIEEWNTVFEERDIVVHRLSQANGWGAPRVERALQMFALLLRRMTAVLAADADEFVAADRLARAARN